MTREESIKELQESLDTLREYDIANSSRLRQALKMAIQALSQEPCDDAVSRESVDRILRDMGVNCAYDMPSFWANKGKDYKVIPTKWHKGYQQAVADFDKRIRELPSVTPSITRDIEKSNFSQEQYLLDTDSAYQIGYEKGKKEDNKPKGKWIDSKGNTVKMIDGVPQDSCWCSKCKTWLTASDEYSCKGYYCPNCGAKMVEPQESEV